jgi:hypothetical protein
MIKMFYFKGMTLQQIREELDELGIVLTDKQFNALTYAQLNSIGRKAFKAYKLTNRIGNIVAHAEGVATPIVSDNTPSTPPGDFR